MSSHALHFDESGRRIPLAVVRYAPTVMSKFSLRILVFSLCIAGALVAAASHARRAAAANSVAIAGGDNASRTTIPVTIDGLHASCVLDTGTSAIIISAAMAESAHLSSRAGSFEVAPDGHTYVDRATSIARLGVAQYALRDVPALISPNVTGDEALCGYDFFAHFPTLIERDRRQVTLFPPSSRLARMHCLPVDLSPRVPLATIEINDTWLTHIVLDSGMAGGDALWDGVRSQLHRPLVADAQYETMPAAVHEGFACGAVGAVRYAPGAPESAMPICTEPKRPDGYNGIVETNLPSVRAMAVDYPHHRICFDITAESGVAARDVQPPAGRNAWARFNDLRPPKE